MTEQRTSRRSFLNHLVNEVVGAFIAEELALTGASLVTNTSVQELSQDKGVKVVSAYNLVFGTAFISYVSWLRSRRRV